MTVDEPCYLRFPSAQLGEDSQAVLSEPSCVFQPGSLLKQVAGSPQQRLSPQRFPSASKVGLPPGLEALAATATVTTMGSLPAAVWSDDDADVSDESESVSEESSFRSSSFPQQMFQGFSTQTQQQDPMQMHVQSMTIAAQQYELAAQQESIRQQQEKLEVLRAQLAHSLARMNVSGAQPQMVAPVQHQRAAPAMAEESQEQFGPIDTSSEVTLMMGNLSSKYTQQILLEEIDAHGFAGTYDFFYLPIDAATKTNRAYAFINLVDGDSAKRFQEFFHGRMMRLLNSGKCTTVKVAALQGFEANHGHFANSRVANRGNVHARPVFLRELKSSRVNNSHKKSGMRNVAVRAEKYAQNSAVMQQVAQPEKQGYYNRDTSFCPTCGVPKGASFQSCVNCRTTF